MSDAFVSAPERRGTDSLKWGLYPSDVLPMWLADMDVRSPAAVRRALMARVEHGVFGYTREPTALREQVVAWLERRHGWRVGVESIVVLPSVVAGFNLACRTFARPGGSVLVQTPVYPPILDAPGQAGLECRALELARDPDGAYGFDPEAFDTALGSGTDLFILCNPHNPVGRAFRRDELEAMAEACLRRGAAICADEIHADLVYPGSTHLPVAALDPDIARRTITLISTSKTFNLPGLKTAFAIVTDRELRRRFIGAGAGLVDGANLMGLTAAAAAYREGEPWLEKTRTALAANRDRVAAFVAARLPGLRVNRPEATCLAWLDARELGEPDPFRFFLRRARVALFDGRAFGPGGEGFLRFNFGCAPATLDAALTRMADAVAARA